MKAAFGAGVHVQKGRGLGQSHHFGWKVAGWKPYGAVQA